MKLNRISALLLLGALATGCYEDFDTPQPAKPYTLEEIEAMGSRHISIAEAKQIYIDRYTLENNGSNTSWSDTKYVQVTEDVFIAGKVISNDEEGNVYKSLYLEDGTGAIEVKLTNGLFLDYPMGHYDPATQTIPSTWVYVRLKDLYIGNYRMMLSIGNGPTDNENATGAHKYYANSNIEDPAMIREHVFRGEPTTLEMGKEIFAFDASNYNELFGTSESSTAVKYLGRLVLLKGVTCRYSAPELPDPTSTAAVAAWLKENKYPSWLCSSIDPIQIKSWYRWAYSNNSTNNHLYGSVLFTFKESVPSSVMSAGTYILRTSGYARFADRPIVKEGEKGDLLALFSIYSKSWSYSYGAYQLTVSRFEDIRFDDSQFLTRDEADALTPNGIVDGIYYKALDSDFVPSTNDDGDE